MNDYSVTNISIIDDILTHTQLSILRDFISHKTDKYILILTGNGKNGKSTLLNCIPNSWRMYYDVKRLRSLFTNKDEDYILPPWFDTTDIFCIYDNLYNDMNQLSEIIDVIHIQYPNKLIIVKSDNMLPTSYSFLYIECNSVFKINPNPNIINEKIEQNLDNYLNDKDFVKDMHEYLSNTYEYGN